MTRYPNRLPTRGPTLIDKIKGTLRSLAGRSTSHQHQTVDYLNPFNGSPDAHSAILSEFPNLTHRLKTLYSKCKHFEVEFAKDYAIRNRWMKFLSILSLALDLFTIGSVGAAVLKSDNDAILILSLVLASSSLLVNTIISRYFSALDNHKLALASIEFSALARTINDMLHKDNATEDDLNKCYFSCAVDYENTKRKYMAIVIHGYNIYKADYLPPARLPD